MEKRLKLKCNFAAPDEHVPDAERLNWTIQDRFRVKYHHLPYKVMPRPMIDHGTMSIPVKRNMFPKKTGISKIFLPRMIVNQEVIDYNKHLKYSFGSYRQASHHNKPQSNNNRARTLDAIYLRPSVSLQDGHNVMDLVTGQVITHPK